MNSIGTTSYELSVNRYHSSISILNANLLFQAIFNLIAFRLIRGEESLTIPIINLSLTVDSLHLVIPISLIVLWLQFGFCFHNIIKLRSEAWRLLRTLVNPGSADFDMAVKLFEDSLLIDGWYFINKTEHLLESRKIITFTFLSVTYFLLLGATNANIIAIPIVFHDMNQHPVILLVFVIFLLFILILSHFQFHRANPNKVQYVIAAIALAYVAFTYLMLPKTTEAGVSDSGYWSF